MGSFGGGGSVPPAKPAPGAVDGGGGGDNSDFIIHKVPEDMGKSRWSHIEDLDSFYRKVYKYHQEHGFKVMMLQVCTCIY